MIINDKEAATRLNSPMNLINRLKNTTKTSDRKSAMSLFIRPSTEQKEEVVVASFNPFKDPIKETSEIEEPAKLDQILENHESQIRLGLAHDKALELLNNSVEMLSTKLDDIKADKLPAVVTAAGKIVESIRKERNEVNKNTKDQEVHFHFYTPEQKKLTDYEVIDVG